MKIALALFLTLLLSASELSEWKLGDGDFGGISSMCQGAMLVFAWQWAKPSELRAAR